MSPSPSPPRWLWPSHSATLLEEDEHQTPEELVWRSVVACGSSLSRGSGAKRAGLEGLVKRQWLVLMLAGPEEDRLLRMLWGPNGAFALISRVPHVQTQRICVSSMSAKPNMGEGLSSSKPSPEAVTVTVTTHLCFCSPSTRPHLSCLSMGISCRPPHYPRYPVNFLQDLVVILFISKPLLPW